MKKNRTIKMLMIMLAVIFIQQLAFCSDNSEKKIVRNSSDTIPGIKDQSILNYPKFIIKAVNFNGNNFIFYSMGGVIKYSVKDKEEKQMVNTAVQFSDSSYISKFAVTFYRNKIYLFFKDQNPGNAIYYITATENPNNNYLLKWDRQFYEVPSTGGTPDITKVINNKLYLIFDYNKMWKFICYDENNDKKYHWSAEKNLQVMSTPRCASVFTTLDHQQKMLIGYSDKDSSSGIIVFDGSKLYGNHPFTSLKVANMAMTRGDIEGCKDYIKEDIQIWYVKADANYGKHDIYHTQFIPGGVHGENSYLSSSDGKIWTQYTSFDNRVIFPNMFCAYMYYVQVDSGTTTDELRKKVLLSYAVPDGMSIQLRTNIFNSDYLDRTSTHSVNLGVKKYREGWILEGVITGVPPFADNGDIGTARLALNNSVSIDNDTEKKDEQKINYNSEVVMQLGLNVKGLSLFGSIAHHFEKIHAKKVVITQGINETVGVGTEKNDSDIGWLVFSCPTFTVSTFNLRDFTKHDLGEKITLFFATNNNIRLESFKLTNPSDKSDNKFPLSFNDDQTWPKSTNIDGWEGKDVKTPSAQSKDYDILFDKTIHMIPGLTSYAVLSKSVEQDDMNTKGNTISIKAGLYGFGPNVKGELNMTRIKATNLKTTLAIKTTLPNYKKGSDKKVNSLTFEEYVLKAKTSNCWWIPKEYSNSRPWCITYRVLPDNPSTLKGIISKHKKKTSKI
jgi:hypothetical protein